MTSPTVYLPSLYDLLIAYCNVRTRTPRVVGKHPAFAAPKRKRARKNSVLAKIPREGRTR
jgi:hypothetical protein